MKIEELIIELLKKGISIYDVVLIEDTIGYRVSGFSKSGTVTLFQGDDTIFALARYKEITKISNFDDLVSLAWYWYINYKDREPFTEPDPYWLPYFIEKNWIETETVTKYKIK
jgi:hypothetical protein